MDACGVWLARDALARYAVAGARIPRRPDGRLDVPGRCGHDPDRCPPVTIPDDYPTAILEEAA